MSQIDEALFSTSEAARFLGRSVDSIRQYERTGRLHAIKVAHGIRLFPASELKRFLEERMAKAGAKKKRNRS